MQKIKILLVEDNPSHALSIEILIEKLGYHLLPILNNQKDALDFLKKETPDIILIDIHLQDDMSGLELAKKVQKKIPIIFITAIEDRVIFEEAKKIQNFGYIVKPFNDLTLESVMETALLVSKRKSTINPENQSIFLKKRNRLEKVMYDDILTIEADGNYCIFYSNEKKYVVKMSLVKVSNHLNYRYFVSVSKNTIVNLKKVAAINHTTNKVMVNKKEILIGRSYKNILLKKIKTLG